MRIYKKSHASSKAAKVSMNEKQRFSAIFSQDLKQVFLSKKMSNSEIGIADTRPSKYCVLKTSMLMIFKSIVKKFSKENLHVIYLP